jgi:RNA polymerase sigma-70 factor (ECF subfamily)
MKAVWPEAYRIAFSILRDAGLAEDAAQEACVSMVRSLPSLKDAGVFPAWTYRIIVNCTFTIARRRTHSQSLDAARSGSVHFDCSDALDLYRALGRLPHDQRAVAILHYYAGLSSVEIAAATGSPPSTIRFRLMLARRALKRALSADASQSTPTEEIVSNVH